MARVLVIDDDLDFCDALCDELRGRGHSVDVAGSGRAALARIELEPYEVAILDLEIPDMQGGELLARLRRDARFADLQIVVCTAYPVTAELKRELAAADSVVQKTGDAEELVRAVGSRPPRPSVAP